MLYPLFAMVVLTVVVGLVAVKIRFQSVKRREVSIRYYRVMEGENIPNNVKQSTRCFNNQFEVPVLFYIVGVIFIALDIHSVTALVLAWIFVVFRGIHAWILLTYNNVVHRMCVYWAAFFSMFGMWIIAISTASNA